MSDNLCYLDDDNFENEVIQSEVPVLVDFWAEWCAPCKTIAPVLEELASEYEGKLKIGKLDIDQSEQIPRKYGIRSIPTLMLFKNGEVEAVQVGALPKARLTDFINKSLS